MDKELIGIGAAAKILGVNEMTIRRWEERDLIPVFRTPKGHRRYKVRDIEQLVQRMKESNPSDSSDDEKEQDEIRTMVSLFCRSLIELQRAIHEGKFRSYPPLWIDASTKIRDYSLKRGGNPFPTTFPAQIEYWEKPLSEWGIPYFDRVFGNDAAWSDELTLFQDSQLMQYCYDKAAEGRNPKKELDLIPFEDMMDECRYENDQHSYVSGRCFPFDYPVVDTSNKWHLKIGIITVKYRNNIKRMYEDIPEAYIYDGKVYLCPYCGWTLSIDWHGKLVCDTPKCRKVANTIGLRWDPEVIDWTQSLQRVRRGIREFLILPGIPELRIYKKLKSINDISVELYPLCDALGDIRIQFEDEKWVVDVKDWGDPRELARKLNEAHPFERFEKGNEWDRGFIVVPKHVDDQYIRILESETKVLPGVSIISESKFLQQVRNQVEVFA